MAGLSSPQRVSLPVIGPRNGQAGVGLHKSHASSHQSNDAVEIEQEMKLLEWHKLANEAALKTALMRDKQAKSIHKSRLLDPGPDRREKALWARRIEEEEAAKPLSVSKSFILEYQRKEEQDAKRLEEEVKKHIISLKKLKDDVASREELRDRNRKFRAERAKLSTLHTATPTQRGRGGVRKRPGFPDRASGGGQGAQNLRNTHSSSNNNSSSNRDSDITATGAGATVGSGYRASSKVQSSLDKLIALEKRISSLENNPLASGSRSSGGASRNRVPGSTAARVGRSRSQRGSASSSTSASSSRRNSTVRDRSSSAARRQSSRSSVSSTASRRNSGTFMTALPSENARGASSRRISAGSTASRTTVRARRGVSSTTSSTRAPARDRSAARTTATGASAGRRTNNRHQQQFNDMKAKVERTKARIAGSRVSRTTPSDSRSAAASSRNRVTSRVSVGRVRTTNIAATSAASRRSSSGTTVSRRATSSTAASARKSSSTYTRRGPASTSISSSSSRKSSSRTTSTGPARLSRAANTTSSTATTRAATRSTSAARDKALPKAARSNVNSTSRVARMNGAKPRAPVSSTDKEEKSSLLPGITGLKVGR